MSRFTSRASSGAILAPYQITRGSLPSITLSQTTSRLTKSSINLGDLPISDTTTVGQLSAAILANNPDFEAYDQLTCFIGSQILDSSTRTPRATIKGYKIILDPDDTTVLWAVVDKFGFSVVDGFLATHHQLILQRSLVVQHTLVHHHHSRYLCGANTTR